MWLLANFIFLHVDIVNGEFSRYINTPCVFADLTDSKVSLSRESKPVDKRNSLNLI